VALVTEEQVKEYMGETGALTSAQQSLLTQLRDGVTRKFEQHTRRPIEQASFTDILDGDGFSDMLVVRHRPLISATVTVQTGRPSGTQTTLTEDTDFELDLLRGIVIRIAGPWTRGRRIVQVDYDAGLVPTPDDLVMAALKQVTYEARLSRVFGGGEERLMRRGTTVGTQTGDFVVEPWAQGVKETLERYLAVAPPQVRL